MLDDEDDDIMWLCSYKENQRRRRKAACGVTEISGKQVQDPSCCYSQLLVVDTGISDFDDEQNFAFRESRGTRPHQRQKWVAVDVLE